MKKLFALVVFVLVAAMLAMPVLAAPSASVSLTASKTSLSVGDTFTVTVSTTKVESCTSGGFLFKYDANAFAYVDGKAMVSGYTMSGISTANNNLAGYFLTTSGGNTVQGDIFQITLKVKANASGSYTISGTPSMKAGNKEEVSFSTGSVTVTVGSSQPAPTTPAPTTPAPQPTNPQETAAPTTAATDPTGVTDVETDVPADIPTNGEDETSDTEKVEEPNQETGAITIGPSDTTDQDREAGFPWWIIFAVMGIGAIVAIVIIKKKS